MRMKTKKEFEKWFRAEVMPYVRAKEAEYNHRLDLPLRREEWNNTIDAMVKGRELPKRAYDWFCPW